MRYSKWLLVAVCLLSPFAWSQVWPSGGPVVNNTGQPLGGATITVCTTNPGGGACGSLVATYTDSGLGTPCALNVTPGPISGIGCTNPGLADSRGNYTIFAASGAVYYAQFSGYGLVTYSTPFTTGGGGGGSVTGTLGQPMYGKGVSPIAAQPTEIALDSLTGSDICAKYTLGESLVPASGGRVLFSAANYPPCAAPLTVTKHNMTLQGAGMGNFGLSNGATVLNFASGVSGIVSTSEITEIKDMTLVSASTSPGSDNCMSFAGGSPKAERVICTGFGGAGVVMNNNTDLWRLDSVYVNAVKGDAFYFAPGCSDQNIGYATQTSATNNGGIGYNVNCGGANTFQTTHAANNAGGAWAVNATYNFILNAYVEAGTGSSFTLSAASGYNKVTFSAFGQPTTIIDSSVAGTNEIFWDAFGGTDGQYPAQTTLSLTGPPQNSPGAFYSWIADTNNYGAQDLILRDRKNALNIYDYVPAIGHSFLRPVSVSGPGQIAIGVNASPVTTANTVSLFGPPSAPGTAWGLQFSATAPTTGQCASVGAPTGSIFPIVFTTCGSGGGGTIPNTLLLLKGDGAGNALAASSGDVIGLFTGCSGTKYLGADGACHPTTGITNAAPVNVVTKSDISGNLVSSCFTDTGSAVSCTEPLNATSLSTGVTPPTACGSATACWAGSEAATAGTPTAGQSYMRWDNSHVVKFSFNNGGEGPLNAGSGGTGVANTASLTLGSSNVNFASFSTGIAKITNSTGAFSTAIAADFPTLNQNTTGTASNLSGTPALPNGTTATTQALADNTTKLATDAFVIANVAVGAGTGFNNGAGNGYQDVLEITAPSNPALTFDRLYLDSGTHLLTCLTHTGGSCAASGGGGLADPGANGVMTRTALNVSAPADAAAMAAPLVATTVGGTANAITLSMTPSLIAQTQQGMVIRFTPTGNNTITNPTINVQALGALTVKKKSASGLVALVSGDIVNGQSASIELDPSVTFWTLTNPQTSSSGITTATAPLAVTGSNIALANNAAGSAIANTGGGTIPGGITYLDQRRAYYTLGTTASPFHLDVGTTAWSVQGTGSSGGGASTTQPDSGNFVSAAANNSGAGLNRLTNNDPAFFGANPRLSAEVNLPSSGDILTNIARIGLYNTAVVANLNTADPSADFIGFRYVAGTDTDWMCESKDGTTGVYTDSGVAVVSGAFLKFVIVVDSTAGTADWYIGSGIQTKPAHVCGPLSTHMPRAAQPLAALAYTISSGSAQNIKIVYIQSAKDY